LAIPPFPTDLPCYRHFLACCCRLPSRTTHMAANVEVECGVIVRRNLGSARGRYESCRSCFAACIVHVSSKTLGWVAKSGFSSSSFGSWSFGCNYVVGLPRCGLPIHSGFDQDADDRSRGLRCLPTFSRYYYYCECERVDFSYGPREFYCLLSVCMFLKK
jgi:hypothetical protein